MANDKEYRDAVVWLPELAKDHDVLDGFTFVNCLLKGPAVVVLLDNVTFTNNELQGHAEGLLWELPPERSSVIGAIGLTNSTVEGCTLNRIGIAGPRDLLAKFKAE